MKQRTLRSESRRLEAKRERSEYRASLWQTTVRWMRPGVLAVWGGFYILVVIVLLYGSESMPWTLNQRVDQDITARVPFDFEDVDETNRRRTDARESAPNVYVLDQKALAQAIADVLQVVDAARTATDVSKLESDLKKQGSTLDKPVLTALQQFAREQDPAQTAALSAALKRLFEQTYIVQVPKQSSQRKSTPPTSIMKADANRAQTVLSVLLTRADDQAAVEQAARQAAAAETLPKPVQPVVAEVVAHVATGRPSPWWVFDQAATQAETDRAEQVVQPVILHYEPGNVLVPANSVLSSVNLEVLRREHDEYLEAQRTVPELRRRTQLMKLGTASLAFLVTLGLAVYTIVYRNRMFQPLKTAGLAGLLLAIVLFSRMTERAQYPWDMPVEFSVAYVVIAAALMAIAYGQRIALGTGGALCVLVTLACRADLGLYLTALAAVSVTIFALKKVRSRSKIIAVGVLAALAAWLAATATGFIGGQDLKYVMVHAVSAAAGALAAGFIVQGILPNFERLFGVATSMTLLEWSDANKPLLRRLAQEAPGTYSHSLVLSQMAEEAAEAIGARGLLCRVGALYHDIGKIQKPEYFVENQEARMNRHDRLSPTMSLLIIVGHVKDGVEMARAYGVPRILHQFIAEHHGTTVVKYFHHQASEAARAKGRDPREAAESEFRYPGPKPRTKETAILMLCDGCEGAVRSLSQPIPGRIESTVHQVVMDRLNDGQFDECEITLRELKLVEKSLVKNLAAVHHGRLKYPKQAAERDIGEPAAEAELANGTPEVARQA